MASSSSSSSLGSKLIATSLNLHKTHKSCPVAAAAGLWHFIDLLPQHAGKGTAMQHVMQHYGFDASATVAAGDSANDLLMLKQVGVHADVSIQTYMLVSCTPTASTRHGSSAKPSKCYHCCPVLLQLRLVYVCSTAYTTSMHTATHM
jgi:trehalose-6-phosphatase